MNKRSNYELNKSAPKQLFIEKNGALKLAECAEDKERIIKEHYEFKNHGHSEIQKIYEKIIRKIKVIKTEVADVLKRCTTCIKTKKSRKTFFINSVAIETSKQS